MVSCTILSALLTDLMMQPMRGQEFWLFFLRRFANPCDKGYKRLLLCTLRKALSVENAIVSPPYGLDPSESRKHCKRFVNALTRCPNKPCKIFLGHWKLELVAFSR